MRTGCIILLVALCVSVLLLALTELITEPTPTGTTVNLRPPQHRTLILFNVFFNTAFERRTLDSLAKQTDQGFDVALLHNPSKYLEEAIAVGKSAGVRHQFVSSHNIEGNVFELIYRRHRQLFDKYEFVAASECDVELDPGALEECINLLTRYSRNASVCYVSLKTDLPKYSPLADSIRKWIPPSVEENDRVVGYSGFQFIVFRKHFYSDFMEAIAEGSLRNAVALGAQSFSGVSDANLAEFIARRSLWYMRTLRSKLDHIGWEAYLPNPSPLIQEYLDLKSSALASGMIRHNINLSDDSYALSELHSLQAGFH
jgi:hypothetical protein